MKSPIRLFLAGFALLGTSCGSGPVGGTESGNPINPPPPPAHESAPAAHIASEFDEEFADIGEPPPDELDPETPEFPSDNADPPNVDDATELPDEPFEPPPESQPPDVTEPDPPAVEPSTPPPSQTAPDGAGDIGGAPASTGGAGVPTSPGTPSSGPSDVPGPASDGDGGLAGSPADCEPSACFAEAEMVAASLAGPVAAPAAYTSTTCGNEQEASVCSCEGNGAAVHLSTADEAECSVSGRFDVCLFDSSEFLGCQPEGEECGSVCAEILERLTDDAAREVEVSTRGASCTSTGECLFVLVADTQCLLGPSLTTVDCSLSDDELLATDP